jgi:glutamate/tyrosine decarboxylase-like PLP-dependent enzyme
MEPTNEASRGPMAVALDRAQDWLGSVAGRAVPAKATYQEMVQALGGDLPAGPQDPAAVVDTLAAAMDPGLCAMGGGRFFGFVVGGAHPAALASDWLVSAWDQNAGLINPSTGVVAAESVAAGWLVDLLGLPAESVVGFVTGGCMANATCLTVARHHVLAGAGWDVEADGLQGAPKVRVIVSQERHATIDVALRYVGLGAATPRRVATDGQGRILLDDLRAALAEGSGEAGPLAAGPTIVCLAAGNVNTGSFDPLAEAIELAHAHGAWVHVDGAFGLWAGAAPGYRHLVAGVEAADSWATDAHKWLNVPYDCGLAITRHPASHRSAMGVHAAYLTETDGPPDPLELVPEFSRRARGVPVYATLLSLGRSGVADLVTRCCEHAARAGTLLGARGGVEVVNDVVLNQVLLRFDDDDATTRAVVAAVVADGAVFLSGTTYLGRAGMRISVSSWLTTDDDIDVLVDAVGRALDAVRSVRDWDV